MPRLGATGSRELRDISRDLKRVGTPGRGLSRKMRRNIIIAAGPLVSEIRANARSIPTHGQDHTGLRASLARATRLSVSPMARRTSAVRVIVDGRRMPENQRSLPPYMEGSDGFRAMRWRHPIYARGRPWPFWTAQESHPYVAPAIPHHLPSIERGVKAAVDEAAAQLEGL